MANGFTVNSFSPKDVQLVVAGYVITGWERISIARSVKGFTAVRGIRGKITRVRNRDSSATITFPLLQTSQSNEVMSYIHELDLTEQTGRLSIILRDKSGKSVFSSDEAYITGYPAVTYSGGFEYRTWEIFMQTTGSYIVAGNTRPSTSLLDGLLDEASSFVNDLF